MIQLLRTNSKNADFKNLVSQLDAELGARDGEEHAFYNQFNSIDNLDYTIVLFIDNKPVACGAIKTFDNKTMEIKRMFVSPQKRGNGYATTILKALEEWTQQLENSRCILETGKRQPEAISLYQKNGYQQIPNYAQYIGIENSVCFEKDVSII